MTTLCIPISNYGTVAALATAINGLLGTAPAGHPDLRVARLLAVNLARATDGRHLDALVLVECEPTPVAFAQVFQRAAPSNPGAGVTPDADPEWEALDRALPPVTQAAPAPASAAPAPAPATAPVPTAGSATEKQVQAIFAIGRAKKLAPDAIRAAVSRQYHREVEQLTKAQASSFIDWLKDQEQVAVPAQGVRR